MGAVGSGTVQEWTRRGMWGSVLLSVGAWGAGALPRGVRDGVWGAPDPALIGVAATVAYAGLGLVLWAWWQLGTLVRAGAEMSRRQQWRTLACWTLPLLPSPLLFSFDVWSYVAQGALALRGWNVYEVGPAVLGGPLAANVPEVWRDSPTPYGPLSALASQGVMAVTGEHHAVAAAVGHRLVALAGLALLAWSVQRLTAGTDAGAGGAWWAAPLNPLVLAHVVGGAHNEGLMLGLMTAGLVAFRSGRWVLGTVVLTAAVLVKAPAGMALACAAAVALAARPGRWRRLGHALGIAAVACGALWLIVTLCGQGWGWLRTVGTPAEVYTPLSVSTDLGRALEWVADTAGWGTAPGAAITATRTVGTLAGLCAVLFFVRRAPRLGAERATALGLLAMVLCAPAVQPWYLLWGGVPLAVVAWRTLADARAKAAVVALLLVFMPSGRGPTWTYVTAAVLGGLVTLAVLAWTSRRSRQQAALT
ncbi:polyprenol phosphomannose-dependent alpha 1,6 mannosyltransferase MptB [Streptomyces minutiscleroticus]|uniref:Alpha-(1->6)-mannopyranosyltransferase n=1 Tax=Streptomyces minutiscleroticus TaxID=68238 RepID=A0A918KE86_9ACTN|nr:polyprenol phosphomannose-dependent alpha 1,6 mannosyltransferase MptB [Streptomyces minutiscleroticus]GGX59171.1 putative alpha-(1->6)-mannopyranosyltransferase [Streptomyces minutiscleroticus]